MAKYHKYVFDTEARRLVGDFETMYAAEDREGFDSWLGHDTRHLRLRVTQALLADYNFSSVLEIGCGKGTTAQFIKRRNNRVLGIDIAPTAIAKAQASFPDIEFRCMDANDIATLGERFDLVSVQGTFAYISAWRDLLRTIAGMTDYCLVAEYIPPNPIGMVKSPGELISAFSEHFASVHRVVLDDEIVILLGRSKSAR
jgi:SAM-dependent methyltransferase